MLRVTEVNGALQLQHGEVVVCSYIVILGMVLDLDHVDPEAVCLSVGVIVMLPQQDLRRRIVRKNSEFRHSGKLTWSEDGGLPSVQ